MVLSFRNLGLTSKLFLLLGAFSAAFFAFALVSWRTIETVRVNGPLYEAIVEGKDLIADVLPPPAYIIESHLLTLQLDEERDPVQQALLIDRGNALRAEYEKRHTFWKRTLAAGKLADTMLVSAHRPALEYFEVRDKEFVPAIRSGNLEKTRATLSVLKARYEEHRRAVDEVVKITTERNAELESKAESSVDASRRTLVSLGLLVVCVVGFIAWVTSRVSAVLTGRLLLAGEVAAQVADGDLRASVPAVQAADESGQLLQSIQRITDGGNTKQGVGFASLKYYGAGMSSDVVLDGGIGAACTAAHMWFLNTKYNFFRPHRDRNFVPIGGERQAVNQDAVVKLIGWAGNLCSSGPQFSGVLIA
jgi:HAMP domain-containing protein